MQEKLQDSPELRAKLLTDAGMAEVGMRWDTPKDSAMKLKETVEGVEEVYVKRAPFLVIMSISKVLLALGEGWVLSLLNASLRNKILTGYRPLASFAGQAQDALRTGVLERNIFGIKVRVITTEVKIVTLTTMGGFTFTYREDDESGKEKVLIEYAAQYRADMIDLGIDKKTQNTVISKLHL